MTVAGYSQSGAARKTKTAPADLRVVIDGQNLSAGLDVQGDGSHIEGLIIHSAAVPAGTADAIRITGDDNLVTGSYLGTDAAGAAGPLNDQGVQIEGDGNQIGGSAVGDGTSSAPTSTG